MAKLCWIAAIFVALCAIVVTAQVQQQMLLGGELVDVTPGTPALYQFIDYVDDSFGYSVLNNATDTVTGTVTFQLAFTSGRWLSPENVTNHLWQHNLVVIYPTKVVRGDAATLYAHGCDLNRPDCEATQVARFKAFAEQNNLIVAILFQIPPQPMSFSFDAAGKTWKEDDFVAQTWKAVIDNPSRPDWNSIMPMSRSVVRALDVIELFSADQVEQGLFDQQIKWFYTMGMSKRAHAVWLSAAYEGSKKTAQKPSRLVGASTFCYDLLNFKDVVAAQSRILGGLTLAFYNYYIHGVVQKFDDAIALQPLIDIIDPLTPGYAAGLNNIPFFVTSGTADEFFIAQNGEYYWDDVKQTAKKLLVPGGNHGWTTSGTVNVLEVGLKALAGHIKTTFADLVVPMEAALAQPCHYNNYFPWNHCLYRTIPSYPTALKLTSAPDYEFKQTGTVASFAAYAVKPSKLTLYYAVNNDRSDWRDTRIVFNTTVFNTATPTSTTWSGAKRVYNYNVDIAPLMAQVPTDGTKSFGYFFVAEYNTVADATQVYSTLFQQLPVEFKERYVDCVATSTCGQAALLPYQ